MHNQFLSNVFLYLRNIIMPMIILLSPSKTLDYDHQKLGQSLPVFIDESTIINKSLKKYSKKKLSDLMKISDKLASLNHARNQVFSEEFTEENSRAAIYAFKGDVYLGLEAHGFNEKELAFANEHIRILSGLYGLLKPLDKMQPYRLEMGTSLKVGRKKSLYDLWGSKISDQILSDLEEHKDKHIINLASNEYFKAVKTDGLEDRIIHVNFKEYRNDKLTFISFNAKKARGMMARYVVKNKLKTIRGLKGFNLEDYSYNEELSDPQNLLFTR